MPGIRFERFTKIYMLMTGMLELSTQGTETSRVTDMIKGSA